MAGRRPKPKSGSHYRGKALNRVGPTPDGRLIDYHSVAAARRAQYWLDHVHLGDIDGWAIQPPVNLGGVQVRVDFLIVCQGQAFFEEVKGYAIQYGMTKTGKGTKRFDSLDARAPMIANLWRYWGPALLRVVYEEKKSFHVKEIVEQGMYYMHGPRSISAMCAAHLLALDELKDKVGTKVRDRPWLCKPPLPSDI